MPKSLFLDLVRVYGRVLGFGFKVEAVGLRVFCSRRRRPLDHKPQPTFLQSPHNCRMRAYSVRRVETLSRESAS